jgi:predicted permease
MIGALLFIGTLQNLRAVNPGFQANGMTLYRPLLRTQGYSPEGGLLLFQEVLARLASTPGITTAGIAHGVPLAGGAISSRVFLPGQDPETGVRVQYSEVSSGYFDAVGTPLIAGRIFTTDETLRGGLEESVIISESLARRLYGSVLAVGKSLMFPSRSEPVRLQIIGVARDVNWDDLAETPPFIVYRPMTRFNPTNIHFVVRSPEEPVAIVSKVRKLIREIDPSLSVEPMTMNQVLSIRMAQQRAFAWVLGLLATMGFMLAFLGIHGLVFQWVTERTPEFGIRIAVGAGRQQIIRLVLRSTLIVVAVGLPLGVALAAVLARVLQNRLFGVSAGEPVAYISAIAALLLIVLGASIIPALSAARSNPADVLRAE